MNCLVGMSWLFYSQVLLFQSSLLVLITLKSHITLYTMIYIGYRVLVAGSFKGPCQVGTLAQTEAQGQSQEIVNFGTHSLDSSMMGWCVALDHHLR